MLVAEAIGATLAGLGVDRVFGVVGSGNFDITDALVARGVQFVAARHESGAATMADGYARTSGGVGVVSLHPGCGLTNALTGITEAAKSRTPVVVIATDTAAAAIRSNFRVDQEAIATAVGAVAERVHSADSAANDTARAFRRAVVDRRTVVLNVRLDVQKEEASDPRETMRLQPPKVEPPRPAAASVTALADALATAERPVFVAGRGARIAAARRELETLAERCGALLATSATAKGLFEGSPWSLDVSGGFASPLTAELIQSADVIVGWGCALNMWTMRQGRLIGPGATVVQVDVNVEALGAHRPVDLAVVGDVRECASAVTDELVARAHNAAGYRSEALAAEISRSSRWRDVPYEDEGDGERIDPRTLSIRLDDLLPEERVVAVDSGNFMGYPSMFLSVPDDDGFCFTQAFQSIGLGLSTAIGAALARTDRLPVAALGDGGALMSIMELETVVRLGLPMVIVIYNDNSYGAEVHHFPGRSHDTVTFPDTDVASIGRGFGCDAVTVRNEEDLQGVAEWLAGPREKPLLVDAKVVSNHAAWWLEEAFKGH